MDKAASCQSMRHADKDDEITPLMEQFVTRNANEPDKEFEETEADSEAVNVAAAQDMLNVKSTQRMHVPGRGNMHIRSVLALANMEHVSKLSADRLVRMQQANAACAGTKETDDPEITLKCDIGVLYPNGTWYIGNVVRMVHLKGTRKTPYAKPVKFATMTSAFHVICNFYREVTPGNPLLYYSYGIDNEPINAAEILTIVDLEYELASGHYKLAADSLAALNDAQANAK